jgi:hypothetical protein
MADYEDRRGPDELYWDEGEPGEPYVPAGGGRMRTGAELPYGAAWSEADSGHSWAQFFHEPVREPYGGASGSGEWRPYGGHRFSYGRESSANKSYGQLYGYEERNYGQRRDSFYADAGATPWWEGEDEPLAEDSGGFTGVGPHGYRRADTRIEEEIVQRLADATWVDASDVEVEVSDGVVTLAGEVETRGERRAAEEVAAEVAGVIDVINRLRARHRGHQGQPRA